MTLVLTREGRTVDRFEFDGKGDVLIGRGEDCDVRIDNLSVSRKHCQILPKTGFHVICDLGSSNGTFVNGKKVTETRLNPGDVITTGEFTLSYTATFSKVDQPVIPLQSQGLGGMTIQITPGQGSAHAAPAARPGTRVTSKIRGHLTLESDQQNVLLQKTTFLIGGADTNDLQVPGRFVPRVCAIILRERFCFRILDVSPKGNAVTVQGKPTRNGELENADQVAVSGLKFRFYKGLPTIEEGPAFTRMHAQTRKITRLQKPR
jgi:pSer/pThr/pTyr-binding forkhead associated (FHA) protein